MSPNKRKRVVLPIKQKLEIIDKLEKGCSPKELSFMYGIGEQTVRDMKKRKGELLSFTSGNYSNLSNRKAMKQATYAQLDKAMLEWLKQQKANGLNVSGRSCMRQAKIFFESFGIADEFSASPGWLSRFRERYGIEGVQKKKKRLKSSGDITNQAEKNCTETVNSEQEIPTECLEGVASDPSSDLPLEDNSNDYLLNWKSYSAEFCNGFQEILEDKDLMDVTVGAQGGYIQAHKIVLSVCSEYFKDLFRINPCKHPIVILSNVDYETFNAIIQFMYTGSVQLPAEKLSSFLNIAEFLKIKGLQFSKDICPGETEIQEIPVSKPEVVDMAPNITENPIQTESTNKSYESKSPSVKMKIQCSNFTTTDSNMTTTDSGPSFYCDKFSHTCDDISQSMPTLYESQNDMEYDDQQTLEIDTKHVRVVNLLGVSVEQELDNDFEIDDERSLISMADDNEYMYLQDNNHRTLETD